MCLHSLDTLLTLLVVDSCSITGMAYKLNAVNHISEGIACNLFSFFIYFFILLDLPIRFYYYVLL